jgi:sodium/hydrogen antiporter
MTGREFFDAYDLLLVALGVVLVLTTVFAGWLKRFAISSTLLYLGVGLITGPALLGLAPADPLEAMPVLERVAELAVIMSLVVLGIRIGTPITWRKWQPTARLILIVMPATIVGVAFLAHWLLGLPLGPAILLGAVLAPTDPILAGPLEEESLEQEDRDRFGLSSEAGLNDGFAFPFVYLGLALTFAPDDVGSWIGRWIAVELLYGVVVALPLGFFLGKGIGRMYVRRHRRNGISDKRREFTPLALLLLTYGFVEAIGAYGFLAAFATGLGFRRELQVEFAALESFANFTEAVDDLVKAVALVVVGALIRLSDLLEVGWALLAFALLLILLLRPALTIIATVKGGFTRLERGFWAWFGIRGIGSMYYLAYALNRGIDPETGRVLFAIVVGTVLISTIVHGFTVAPFLRRFEGEENVEL